MFGTRQRSVVAAEDVCRLIIVPKRRKVCDVDFDITIKADTPTMLIATDSDGILSQPMGIFQEGIKSS